MRPVAKIGLIAPFEGLYRQSGYEALAAVRAAIEACAPAGVDVLPLALDDSDRPDNARRAAAKLLTDPTVAAVIGPLSLDTAAAVTPELAPSEAVWIVPSIVDASGRFGSPTGDQQWLAALIVAIAAAAQRDGAQQLAVAGIPQEWLASTAAHLAHSPGAVPIRLVNLDAGDSADPGAQGALLWLGAPHEGARLLAALRTGRPDAAFWMGPQGGDPVFAGHAVVQGPVYWASWANAQYNSTSQPDAPDSPAAFLTYQAACHALESISGRPPAPAQPLYLHVFRMTQDGKSHAAWIEPAGQ